MMELRSGWASGPGRMVGALLAVAVLGVSGAAAGDGKHPRLMLAQSAEDIANEVEQLEALLAGLSSDNRLVRIATYRAILERGDSLAVSFAIDAALDGDDGDLKTMAMRDWLRMHGRLIAELVPPARPSDQQVAVHDEYSPFWFEIVGVEETELHLRFQGGMGSREFFGSFVPSGFVVTNGGCALDLRVVDSSQFLGSWACTVRGTPVLPIPVVVEVQ